MPVLLGLLTAIGLAVFFIIRANNAARAARELGEIAGDVAGQAKGVFRRNMWRRRVETDPIKINQDPRLAAAIIMCAIAQADSDLSSVEIETMLTTLQHDMGLDFATAQELQVSARQLIHGQSDTNTITRRAAVAINQNCSDVEKSSLVNMLQNVAAADGAPTSSQTEAIDRLRGVLGLRHF